MSSANVLPSAPPEGVPPPIYPNLNEGVNPLTPVGAGKAHVETQKPISASLHDFPLSKVNEIAAELAHEVQHYRLVGKEYKLAKTVANWLAGSCDVLSTAAFTASLDTALSFVEPPAAVPLAAFGWCFALASSRFVVTGKRLDAKIKTHHKIVTLALAKRDTVDRLLSKAIQDNRVSDAEFQIIVPKLEQYNILKEKVRAKLTRKPSRQNVDVKQIQK